MAFFKINPTQFEKVISLASLGIRPGEFFTIRLVGDFSAAFNPPFDIDAFMNSEIFYDGISYSSNPDLSRAIKYSGTTTVRAQMNDTPLSDNSDPDNDYGVIIEASGLFSDLDDTVDYRIPIISTSSELKFISSFDSIYDLFHRAGDGNDTVYLPSASTQHLIPSYTFDPSARFRAESGNDTIFGADLDDIVEGDNGNDELHGGQGLDILFGEVGNDKLFGNEGNDSLFGQDGQDTLYGFTGNDTLWGGDENDLLDGGANQDMIDGGVGNDVLSGGYNIDIVTNIDDSEIDILTGGAGRDFFYAGVGDKITDLEVGESVELLGTADIATHLYIYRSGSSTFLGAFSDSIIPKTVAEFTSAVDPRSILVATPNGGNAIFTRVLGENSIKGLASDSALTAGADILINQINSFRSRTGIEHPSDVLIKESASKIAEYLSTAVLKDSLEKFVPVVGNVLGLQELIQTIVLDYVYDYYSSNEERASAYFLALTGLAGPAGIVVQVGSFFITEFVKQIAISLKSTLESLELILPDSTEDRPDLNSNPSPDYIVLPVDGREASVRGEASSLDGDVVFGFGSGDSIVITGVTFDSRSVHVTYGSAILDIDIDLDGQIDSRIILAGDYEGVGFEVNSVGDNTEITVSDQTTANEIIGTKRNDTLLGTDGDDLFRGGRGSDRMTGLHGDDSFVFGAETFDARREHDFVLDYEVDKDAIVLEDGAQIRWMKNIWNGVLIVFEGDRDRLRVFGEDVSKKTITIVEDDGLLV